ncbi:MAG: SDR family NAD(P)-dependent oxidoreductase [Acidobacteriota bacterium]
MKASRISVVVPVYNEAGNVGTFVERTVAALEKITADFEIIFVLDAVARSIETSNGVPVLADAIEVAKDDLVGRLVQRVFQRFGRIDVLVNNAGALGSVGSIESADPGRITSVFDVNVIGIPGAVGCRS